MLLAAALLLTTNAAAAPTPPAHAIAVARARILAPAEVRRVDGRLVIRTGSGKAPTEVHQTRRPDGGATADYY